LKGQCIAVFGDESTVSGTGSGRVQPAYVITAQDGIRKALSAAGYSDSDIAVKYLSGLNNDLEEAKSLASSCGVSVVVVATTCGEGNDRETLSLGTANDELVEAIVSVSSRTVVSVVTPAAVLLPWRNLDKLDAILISWLPGQEAGNALADVLFGKVNPSARLPVTIPNIDNEVEFTARQYPGVGIPPEAYYTEKLLIGYRWYDYHGVTPAYCFGHGLSYTKFSYGSVKTSVPSTSGVVQVDIEISNVGSLIGSEVVQLYLSFPTTVQGEPKRQLKGLVKVRDLTPGSAQTVSFVLTERDVSIWDESVSDWRVTPGTFTVFVGASSCDLSHSTTFVI